MSIPDTIFSEEYDVIVIGSGFAGLAAGIEAKIAGGNVIILEKMRARGGNSAISDGFVAAAGTQQQAKHGIKDSPRQMENDMMTAGLGLNHSQLVRKVTENSNAIVEWTKEEFGISYADRVEQLGGHSVPRTLWLESDSKVHTGATLVQKMIARTKVLGIEIRTQACLESFMQDEEGRVVGLNIIEGSFVPKSKDFCTRSFRAKRGVILATGGFANDIDFRMTQDPRLDSKIETTNRRGSTAEAMKEALRLGAMPIHLSLIQIGPWATPDEKGSNAGANFAAISVFSHGIVVDPHSGRRILNEHGDRKQRADAIIAVGHPCIGLVDAQGAEFGKQLLPKCLKKGSVKAFDSIHDLAQNFSIPANRLQKTVDQFNHFLSTGNDTEFKRSIYADEKPLQLPPFYAIRLWPKVHYTMGGIQIDTKARVIGLDQKPILGLFAAGEVTGGIHGACRLGSCSITECLVFGRIAGLNSLHQRPLI